MKYQHPGVEEREEIQLGLLRGESLRTIAKRLNRDHTSLGRELFRNSSPVVDRRSGLLLLSKLSAKTAKATREVVSKRLANLPSHTLTVDGISRKVPTSERYQKKISREKSGMVHFNVECTIVYLDRKSSICYPFRGAIQLKE